MAVFRQRSDVGVPGEGKGKGIAEFPMPVEELHKHPGKCAPYSVPLWLEMDLFDLEVGIKSWALPSAACSSFSFSRPVRLAAVEAHTITTAIITIPPRLCTSPPVEPS